MKVTSLIILTLGLSQLALSTQSHYLATCNKIGWVYSEIVAFNDRIPFCSYGSTSIGADTLEKWINERISTEARQAFVSGQWPTCRVIQGRHEEVNQSRNFSFCKFSDDSVIEWETLQRGLNDPSNSDLRALLL